MNDPEYNYTSSSKSWLTIAAVSLMIVLVLSYLLLPKQERLDQSPITVYCAAGLRIPVEQAAKQYEEEFSIPIRLDFGSSGAMETRIRADVESALHLGDIFLPADASFAERTKQDGVTLESIPLGTFSLCLALRPGLNVAPKNLDELLALDLNIAICDLSAAAGKKLKKSLSASGHWELLQKENVKSAATVIEAATWVKESDVVDVGFVWTTTAAQHGLQVIQLPELATSMATVTASISAGSKQPAKALHFARYLQAPTKGAQFFKQAEFGVVEGDQWASKPDLVFYCGGLNRDAVEECIKKFELREGVQVKAKYGGCGMLVTDMRASLKGGNLDAMPDAYFTCDASYMEMVQEHFGQAVDLSSTRVVILVHKGNPKGIKTLLDLAREDVRAATTNAKFSALGDLSWQLLEAAGVSKDIAKQRHIVSSATTAHDLILQMQNHNVLDAALVYKANCSHLADDFDLIAIEHPRAQAIQNLAKYKGSQYPYLAERFMQAMFSLENRDQFIDQGFNWVYKQP